MVSPGAAGRIKGLKRGRVRSVRSQRPFEMTALIGGAAIGWTAVSDSGLPEPAQGRRLCSVARK
jgi:hypothetical protein